MNVGTSMEFSRKEEKTKKTVPLLLVAVMVGTLLGSALYSLYPCHEIWQGSLFRQGMGTTPAAFEFPDMLLAICGVSVVWTLLAAVLGMSLAGPPLTICLLVFRASALGVVLAELYVLQGLGGFLTALLFVMPYALFTMFVFGLGIRESLKFSLSLLRLVRQNREEPLSVRLYAVRFLILLILMIAAGLLQCVWLKYGYSEFLKMMVKG